MKFCVHETEQFRYLDKVDEVIVFYNANLVNYVKSKKIKSTQRVIIEMGLYPDAFGESLKDTEILLLKQLKSEYPNIAVRGDFSDEERETLNSLNIPYFSSTFCKSLMQVYAQVQQGNSDVYIVEGLGFSLKQISAYCKSKGVTIRAIPNVAQYPIGYKKEIPDVCKFFIRPEDLELYENYIDVCEFRGSFDKLSATFSVYKTGRWLGDLKDLIGGLDENIYNAGLAPQFGMARLNCGHKCMLEQCRLCPELQKIAENFKALELEIKKTDIDRDWRIDELKTNKETV